MANSKVRSIMNLRTAAWNPISDRMLFWYVL